FFLRMKLPVIPSSFPSVPAHTSLMKILQKPKLLQLISIWMTAKLKLPFARSSALRATKLISLKPKPLWPPDEAQRMRRDKHESTNWPHYSTPELALHVH